MVSMLIVLGEFMLIGLIGPESIRAATMFTMWSRLVLGTGAGTPRSEDDVDWLGLWAGVRLVGCSRRATDMAVLFDANSADFVGRATGEVRS
jgi:hypothetical protein